MRKVIRRPSPAMVVALVALVVASAGTATAGSLIIRSTGQVKAGSINSGDLENGKGVNLVDLTPRAQLALEPVPGQRGAPGPPGPQGEQGAQGERGEEGEPGRDGSAVAYAHVNPDGTFNPSTARGINSISLEGGVIFCFDLDPAAKTAVASVDAAGTNTNFFETIYPALSTAPGGEDFIFSFCTFPRTDAAVVITDLTTGNPVARPFWISFN